MNIWLVGLFIIWIGGVIFLRYYRVWLFYYILGTVGSAYWFSLVVRNAWGVEPTLAHSVAQTVHSISNFLGIPTLIFTGAPGVLLVLVVVQEIGWTVLQIGVESSGLLEISVLISLIAFYPGFSVPRKAITVLVGVIATWIANVMRILVIVVMLNQFGKDILVLAHTYIGKVVFFAFTIWIYWLLITSQTLRVLWQKYNPPTEQQLL
jgi:exosortase family protein XrtG